MSAHLTEEEQIEALKRWWQENGKNTLVAVAVAVAGYFGFEAWQGQVQASQEAASDKYKSLIEAVVVDPGSNLSPEQRATAESLATELKSEAADSFYGQSAALFMAKLAIESLQLEKAEAELQWVLEQQPEVGIKQVANLRLARVQAASKQFDKALATLSKVEPGSFASAYADVRGDILLAMGDQQGARAAYQLALTSLSDEDYNQRNSIQVKLDDLAVAVPMLAAEEAGE